MKFTNGCWVDAENTALFSPAQVYEYHIGPEKVRLCCPTGKITSRGATLGGVVLTLSCGALGAKAIWLALLPLGFCFAVMLRADLVVEKAQFDRKPRGH